MGKSILLAVSTLKFEGTDSGLEADCTYIKLYLPLNFKVLTAIIKRYADRKRLYLPLNLKVLTACKSKRADTQKYKVVSE